MKKRMEAIISQHGQSAVLVRKDSGETVELRAFLQPILKKQLHPPVAVTPLGAVSEQRWTYIGPGSIAVAPGDRLRQNDLLWVVQESRGVFCGDTLLYRWALLRPAKEAA